MAHLPRALQEAFQEVEYSQMLNRPWQMYSMKQKWNLRMLMSTKKSSPHIQELGDEPFSRER